MASDTPQFELPADQLADIRSALGITDEAPAEGAVIDIPEQPPVKRKRGRPRKNPLPVSANEDEVSPTSIAPAAPLTKRDEREVSTRLQSILMGGTGLASTVKPYMQMTEEEAKAIADPLSSYLVRNSDTIPIAKQVLENYDLLAITLGLLAYVVRVYRERSIELSEQARTNPKSTTLDRVAEHTKSNQNGQEQGDARWVSVPNG